MTKESSKYYLEELLKWLKRINARSPMDLQRIAEQNELEFAAFIFRFDHDLLFRLTILNLFYLIDQYFIRAIVDNQLAQVIEEIKEEYHRAVQQRIFSDKFLELLKNQSAKNIIIDQKNHEKTWIEFQSLMLEYTHLKRLHESLNQEYQEFANRYYHELSILTNQHQHATREWTQALVSMVFNESLPVLPFNHLSFSRERLILHIQKAVNALTSRGNFSNHYISICREACSEGLIAEHFSKKNNYQAALVVKEVAYTEWLESTEKFKPLFDNIKKNAETPAQLEGYSVKLSTVHQKVNAQLEKVDKTFIPEMLSQKKQTELVGEKKQEFEQLLLETLKNFKNNQQNIKEYHYNWQKKQINLNKYQDECKQKLLAILSSIDPEELTAKQNYAHYLASNAIKQCNKKEFSCFRQYLEIIERLLAVFPSTPMDKNPQASPLKQFLLELKDEKNRLEQYVIDFEMLGLVDSLTLTAGREEKPELGVLAQTQTHQQNAEEKLDAREENIELSEDQRNDLANWQKDAIIAIKKFIEEAASPELEELLRAIIKINPKKVSIDSLLLLSAQLDNMCEKYDELEKVNDNYQNLCSYIKIRAENGSICP